MLSGAGNKTAENFLDTKLIQADPFFYCWKMSTLYKKYNLYIYTDLESKIKQKNIYDTPTYTLLHPPPLSLSPAFCLPWKLGAQG